MKRSCLNPALLFVVCLSCSCNDQPAVNEPLAARDTIPPNMNLLCRTQDTSIMPFEYADPGVLVNDDLDNTPYLETKGTVNHTLSGTYVLRYEASDAAGNKSALTRTVVVVENNAAILMGNYNVSCTCTATKSHDPNPVVTVSTYTAKVTTAKRNNNFEVWLLRVGPEDLSAQSALIGDSIDFGFFSATLNWQVSSGTGRLSLAKDTIVLHSRAYQWDPAISYKCTNMLVKERAEKAVNF